MADQYIVSQANGRDVTISADSVQEENGRVQFFEGDEQVASFVGHQSFRKVQPEVDNGANVDPVPAPAPPVG